VMEGDEECDDGLHNSDSEPDACRTDCTLPRCGDGVCDTADLGGHCAADCSVVVFWEDFEGAWPGGWTTGDNNSSSGIDTWGRSTRQAHSPSRSLWCAEDGDQDDRYDNDMQAWADHPVNLAAYADRPIYLSLWIWVHTHPELGLYYDTYSTRYHDGSTWHTLETTSGNTGGWVQKTYDISSQAGNPSFVLRLYFYSNYGWREEGAYVDDILITAVL